MARSERKTYGRRHGSRSKLLLLIDFVMLMLTLFSAVALLMAYVSKYVNPNSIWVFAFFGLGAPFIYIANILFCLYWIIRWRIYAFISAAVLLLGIGSVSLFFRPSLSKNYEHSHKDAFVVMTYNVMGFVFNNKEGAPTSSIDSIGWLVREIKPDILCLQEYQSINENQKLYIDSVLNIPYSETNYKIANSKGGGWGTAIYSNFPILDVGRINFKNTTNSAMWIDIKMNNDTVRIFNNHLQTTSVNSSDIDYINSHEFLLPNTDREDRVRNIVSKLKNNFQVRADQADSIAPIIRNTHHNVIVCGDFNDTPMSYVYSTIRGDLADSFVEKGRGMPNTFKGLFNMIRIDYIMHSKELEIVNYITPSYDYSDHKPVIAIFERP